MGQELYGPWATGQDRDTLSRALLALGILAAAETPFPLTPVEGIAKRLGMVLANPDRRRRVSPHRWAPPLVEWIDPLALPYWPSIALATEPAMWATAFNRAVPYPATLRLTMSVAPASDISWLAGSIRLVSEHIPFSIARSARASSPWRFPLRIGFLSDERSSMWLAELVAGFTASSWQSTLIDPYQLSPARPSCDLVLLPGEPLEAPGRLLSLPEVRATGVLLPDGLPRSEETGVMAKIADIAGSWAVGCVAVPDVESWLVDLVQQLSHAAPLDHALTHATPGPVLLTADPSILERETVEQRASRLADQLGHLADSVVADLDEPARELARDLVEIVETGLFVSEAGDASDIARLELRAGQLIDRMGGARRLQARISRAGEPAVGLAAFHAGTDHEIEVRIGRLRDADWLAASAAFPEHEFEPDQPHELTVVLTEPTLLSVPQVATVYLPVVGDSTSANFTLTTGQDTAIIDARLIVLCGNRVLQTARLPAEVGAREPGPQIAQPETAIAPATSAIGDRRGFGAAFVVNRNADGRRRATAIAGREAGMVNLDSATIAGARDKLARRLNEIVDTPEDFGSIDSPASVELLTFLAFHGAVMRDALVTDSPGLAQVLARPSSAVQVVSAKPDVYFPFEFAYEFTSPVPGAALCPGALVALQSSDLLCPERHTSGVVCPTGFWGLHRVIERHAYQAGTRIDADFLVRSAPSRHRGQIKLGSAIFAASDRVDQVVPGGTQAVAGTLHGVWPHTQVASWSDWRTVAAATTAPALLLLLPHTTYNTALDAFGLEIGIADAAYTFRDCLPAEEHPVVVVLLGCDTARVGELTYETFPGLFRLAGAEVVVATLTEVLGRHAAPIASRLITELTRQSVTAGEGVGDLLLRARRALLAEGLLAVLALACFGDADWMVGA